MTPPSPHRIASLIRFFMVLQLQLHVTHQERARLLHGGEPLYVQATRGTAQSQTDSGHCTACVLASVASVSTSSSECTGSERPAKRAGSSVANATTCGSPGNKSGLAIDGRCNSSLSLIHISEPTRQAEISYAVFCL